MYRDRERERERDIIKCVCVSLSLSLSFSMYVYVCVYIYIYIYIHIHTHRLAMFLLIQACYLRCLYRHVTLGPRLHSQCTQYTRDRAPDLRCVPTLNTNINKRASWLFRRYKQLPR